MFKFYRLESLPIILNFFEITNIVISGASDKEILDYIYSYCNESNASFTIIDTENNGRNNCINDYALNALPKLNNFDAIFINDDPNWYTVYNELKITYNHNKKFPLVFICNNIFPYERKDYYIDPNIIPIDFRNNVSNEIEYDKNFQKGLYKSSEENTPKNGVLTAIEDFLVEHESIQFADFKLLNGISVLYSTEFISSEKLLELYKIINEFSLELENNTLDNSEDTEYHQNKNVFKTESYLNSNLYDEEINYKNSQLNNLDSKLSLKNTQIKNIESKLFNRETQINNLNTQIISLKNELVNKNILFKDKERELNYQIKSLKSNICQKEKIEEELANQLQISNDTIKNKQNELNLIKHQYTYQLSKLDNKEYCISCYKEEINNNHLEIQYLKKTPVVKKLLNPLAYLYLLFKSKPSEIFLNFKLYKALKNSKCFDIGYYLNNNKDVMDSVWCKYFSPELHYICKGFDEKREFNKKYFNRNSKKELLNYIILCDS